MMTALGAVVYAGFFLLAALWLVVTGDYEAMGDAVDDGVEPGQQGRANPVSVPAG